MLLILGFLSYLSLSNSALLLWTSQQLNIPAFKMFDQDDFEEILKHLNQPNIIAFNVDGDKIVDVIPRKIDNLYSSYIPMTTFFLEDTQDLSDDLATNTKLIKDYLEQYKNNTNNENVLIAIFFETNRVKREDKDENVTEPSPPTPTLTPTVSEPPIIDYKGPVLYNGEGTVLIYSSQPPKLRFNSTVLYLRPAKNEFIDVRDGYTRLTASIGLQEGKIILRFKFPTANGYWSLTSVEVVNMLNDENKAYNLSITESIGAPNHFSYHCHKDTIFKDATGNVELILYKIQTQPDAKKGRFCDAYNCVNFMTGPIWSGILVTASLIVGFFIALAALGDIKTMDKFDNYRTKQLNITVAE